ncbi:histidine kinase [Roseateles noduli]|nr:histidine kinase [Roseateles noduli]
MAWLVLLVSLVLAAVVTAVALSAFVDRAFSPALHLTEADWQVSERAGRVTPPATQDADALPQDWHPVTLPLALPIALLSQAEAAREGDAAVRTTWLRVRVPSVPGHARGLLAGQLGLYGARIKTDGTIAVYADGHLVHRAQEQGPLWNSTRTPLWVSLEPPEDGHPVREFLIRLEHTSRSQVAVSSLWLGPVDALRARYHLRAWLQLELPAILGAGFAAIGVFALFVWIRRPHETGYLLFFNLAATSYLRGLHFYVSLPIANDAFAWLTVNSLFWLVTVVHFFLRSLHGQPMRGMTRALVTVTVLVGIATLPLPGLLPNTPRVTPLLYLVVAGMGIVVGTAGARAAWKSSREGRLVAAGIGACVLLGMSDWALQNNVVSPEGWYLGAYANAVALTVFGLLMYRRYVQAIATVEDLNASLAERLAAREAELDESHRRLREIERQQAVSDERQRLMQDMHDGLGAALIGAIRSAERGALPERDVARVLQGCLDDLKLTIDSMEPVEADLLLLLATLRFRLEPRLEGSGVALRWEVREVPQLPWLEPSSALHIMRIVQESIANVLRHTRASEICLSTSTQDDGVCVEIVDNGQGFDVAATLARGGGRGLQNQQRRAAAIGARVDWQSGAQGTRFRLWLPLGSSTSPSPQIGHTT